MPGARDVIEGLVAENAVVYGVTPGFGDLATTFIDPAQAGQLQRNLLMSHAAGVGSPFPREIVRAMLLLRANTLALGHSGCRPVVVDAILALLANGIHPVVPEQGSVGASGDLGNVSPLSTYTDTLSWTKANHAVKSGVEFRYANTRGYQASGLIPSVTGGAGDIPVRGIDTTRYEPGKSMVAAAPAAATATAAAGAPDAKKLIVNNSCTACHGVDNKIVGPSFREVGSKYQGRGDAEAYLVKKIKEGGQGSWGAVPMPPQPTLKDGDAKAIASWILGGAK